MANALNTVEGLRFVPDQRGVRERYTKLERNFKRKMATEERASGISPERIELDEAVESIIERKKGAEHEMAYIVKGTIMMMESGKETAESVRKRSMERLAEKRETENQRSGKKKKSGSTGEEILELMKEKWRLEMDLRREEFDIRKKEYQAKGGQLNRKQY